METLRLFRATRQITVYEDVEVFANTSDEARDMFEDDDGNITLLSERDNGYEVTELIEVKD